MPQSWLRLLARLRRPLMAVGLLLALNLIAYAAWVRPTATALSDQEARSQAIRVQLQELFSYQKARQDLAALAPSKKELPQAIGRVSALGRRSGVSMPDMNFQPSDTGSPHWSKVQLQFSARGTYANLRRFAAAIEGAEEPFVIETISLSKEAPGQIVGRFAISLYARDE